jgi:hypothetical protein
MTLPNFTKISVDDIEQEIALPASTTAGLDFLTNYIKPGLRNAEPDFQQFWGKKYYLQNSVGNCDNENAGVTMNCNAALIDYTGPPGGQCQTQYECDATNNCTVVGGANCDLQAWLQTGDCNVYPTPTYNCTPDQNCFVYNCNCSKIICTKLFEIGLMKQNIFEADQAFGAQLIKTNPDIYNGYRAWAEIVVDWMSGKGPKMMPWMNDEDFSVAAKKWSTTWAYDIATPWAEEMAYMMGEKETGSLTGKMIMVFGIPICKVIGVWQRWFGPSKKKPGFMKGAGLVVIFIGFKLVAELGRLIEKLFCKKELFNA